jgi:hypothetical protein
MAATEKEKKKIQDFGDKIGGSRKDAWRKGGLKPANLAEMTPEEIGKHVNKASVWPAPDYAEMIEGGVSPEVALSLKLLRDSVPNTPWEEAESYSSNPDPGDSDFSYYVAAVSRLKEAFDDACTVEEMQAAATAISQDKIRGPYMVLKKLRRSLEVIQSDGTVEKTRAAVLFKKKSPNWPDKEAMWKKMARRRGHEVKAHPEKADSFWISDYTWQEKPRDSNKFYPTREEAEATLKKMMEGRINKATEGTDIPAVLESIERIGPDYRNGQDITEEDFQNVFGFRGGEFGNWTNQRDRQVNLNYAFDSLCDLADVAGIDRKDISLDGSLAIAFGARGRGGNARAHYEPGRDVINLTKLSGAGALAHEWFHALDHHINKKATVMAERRSKTGALADRQDALAKKMAAFARSIQELDRVMPGTLHCSADELAEKLAAATKLSPIETTEGIIRKTFAEAGKPFTMSEEEIARTSFRVPMVTGLAMPGDAASPPKFFERPIKYHGLRQGLLDGGDEALNDLSESQKIALLFYEIEDAVGMVGRLRSRAELAAAIFEATLTQSGRSRDWSSVDKLTHADDAFAGIATKWDGDKESPSVVQSFQDLATSLAAVTGRMRRRNLTVADRLKRADSEIGTGQQQARAWLTSALRRIKGEFPSVDLIEKVFASLMAPAQKAATADPSSRREEDCRFLREAEKVLSSLPIICGSKKRVTSQEENNILHWLDVWKRNVIEKEGLLNAPAEWMGQGKRTEGSNFYGRSIKLDRNRKVYFSLPHEMGARAFESWVFDRLEAAGRRCDYLTDPAKRPPALAPGEAEPDTCWYPLGDDRKEIGAALTRFSARFAMSNGYSPRVCMADKTAYIHYCSQEAKEEEQEGLQESFDMTLEEFQNRLGEEMLSAGPGVITDWMVEVGYRPEDKDTGYRRWHELTGNIPDEDSIEEVGIAASI